MMVFLNWRLWGLLALTAALALTHYKAFKGGKAAVRAEWAAATLAASEAARQQEKALTIANQGVDHALQIAKARRAATDRATADGLRDLQAALAAKPDDATTSGGVDGPYRAIASECAGALQELDSYAASLAIKATALQDYTRKVCLKDASD